MAENGSGQIIGADIGNLTFVQQQQFDEIIGLLQNQPHASFDPEGDLCLEMAHDKYRFTVYISDNPLNSHWFLISRVDDLAFSGRLTKNFADYYHVVQELIRLTLESK